MLWRAWVGARYPKHGGVVRFGPWYGPYGIIAQRLMDDRRLRYPQQYKTRRGREPKMKMKCGARGSRLSIAQATNGLRSVASSVEGFKADLIAFVTPGDRDLSTPIEKSAPDFFTRDLDEAVRDGRIDFAIHSAKDLPEPVADDLDWFWLPEREDPRDCWVVRKADEGIFGKAVRNRAIRIGVSSERRSGYARKRFSRAKLLPIRGAIDSRLAQLVEGRYDAVLMAMAGLKRLFPEWKEGCLSFGSAELSVIPISVAELPPPEGQGRLAVVYRKGNVRMNGIRRTFMKAVRFTSAGIGSPDTMTVRALRDIDEADVVLADELSGASGVGHDVEWIDVGKRCGAHTKLQPEITRLICDEVRKGKRVVRLKGGDAGLFGRLSEEVEALDALGIPYVVRPGVSALTAATTPNGLLLTKRGEASGFNASTPRSSGTKTPQIFFMATRMAREMLQRFPAEERYAMVWDAYGPNERVETGLCGNPQLCEDASPGLLVVGFAGTPFARRKVLVTCSETIMPRAVCMLEDKGLTPVAWPMISLGLSDGVAQRIEGLERRYDAVVLTSPVAVRMFFSSWKGDRRRLPEIWTCGAGTDFELRKYGLSSDIMPPGDFSANGLIAQLKLEGSRLKGKRVLRLRSAKASRIVASSIRRMGAKVDDVVLYGNEPVVRDGVPLPECDAVFFASSSAVECFVAQYGSKTLSGMEIYVIGEPTRNALPPRLRKRAKLMPLAKPVMQDV